MPVVERFIRFWISVYYRIVFGKISFEAVDFMDAWGSSTMTEWKAWARGKEVGYCAYGSWNTRWYNGYAGQHLHKWCYDHRWGWE